MTERINTDRHRRPVPLVRVDGDQNGLTVQGLANDPRLLRTFKSDRTRKVEALLGLGDCLYFFAGHACPEFGDLVFVYDPSMSSAWPGTATPFDTGGLVGYIHANGLPGAALLPETRLEPNKLTDSELNDIREYLNPSDGTLMLFPLAEWQGRFQVFLETYFDHARDYVKKKRPNVDDATGRHHHPENKRRAWTWEIQAHRDHDVFDGLWLLCMSHDAAELLKQAREQASEEIQELWSQVLGDSTIFRSFVAAEAEAICRLAEKEIAAWL